MSHTLLGGKSKHAERVGVEQRAQLLAAVTAEILGLELTLKPRTKQLEVAVAANRHSDAGEVATTIMQQCTGSSMHWKQYALAAVCTRSSMHSQQYALAAVCTRSSMHS